MYCVCLSSDGYFHCELLTDITRAKETAFRERTVDQSDLIATYRNGSYVVYHTDLERAMELCRTLANSDRK